MFRFLPFFYPFPFFLLRLAAPPHLPTSTAAASPPQRRTPIGSGPSSHCRWSPRRPSQARRAATPFVRDAGRRAASAPRVAASPPCPASLCRRNPRRPRQARRATLPSACHTPETGSEGRSGANPLFRADGARLILPMSFAVASSLKSVSILAFGTACA